MSGSNLFIPHKNNKTQYTSPGSYNFVVPKGINEIRALITGGGGGGSRISGLGGAGGGGGACKEVILTVTPGETLTVVVGSGGAGGTIGDFDGKEGQESSITGSFGNIRARGGYGTQSGQSTPALMPGNVGAYRNVGAGVGGSGNDGTHSQTRGEDGLYGKGGSTAGHPNPGSGGGSYGDGGAVTSGAGLPGTFGGGGSGGNSADGGNGGNGIVILRYGSLDTL